MQSSKAGGKPDFCSSIKSEIKLGAAAPMEAIFNNSELTMLIECDTSISISHNCESSKNHNFENKWTSQYLNPDAE